MHKRELFFPQYSTGITAIVTYCFSIVITNSNDFLKGSSRSVYNYNIGRVIKNLIDKDIIISGGGHNMAAGFTLKKDKLKKFEDFILKQNIPKIKIKN